VRRPRHRQHRAHVEVVDPGEEVVVEGRIGDALDHRPGIVDKDVDAAQPLRRFLDDAAADLRRADITQHDDRRAAGGRNLVRHLPRRVGVLVAVHGDRDAPRRQRLGHGHADAGRRAGHQRPPASEILEHSGLSLPL
jgi:hypothetical protein